MKNILIVAAILLYSTMFSSCGQSDNNITIINNTKDSLYYYIHQYKKENNFTGNIAYESVDTTDTKNKPDFTISYKINPCKLFPHDTLHPTIMNTTWAAYASKQNGLTILFYKRDIEKFPANQKLTAKDIFKWIDLTAKQLDGLKYRVVLN
jgi:hypothetical protein